MTIDETRAWFVARGWGITGADQLFYERLAGILEEGEAPEMAVAAICENAVGHAVLTDRRLLHVGGHIIKGLAVAAVNRTDILGVKLGGLVLGKVTVKRKGPSLVLGNIPKPQAKALVKALGY